MHANVALRICYEFTVCMLGARLPFNNSFAESRNSRTSNSHSFSFLVWRPCWRIAAVDDCAVNNGGCEQLCANVPGGAVECSCGAGLQIDTTNGKSCVGKCTGRGNSVYSFKKSVFEMAN